MTDTPDPAQTPAAPAEGETPPPAVPETPPVAVPVAPPDPEDTAEVPAGDAVDRTNLDDALAQEAQATREQAELVAATPPAAPEPAPPAAPPVETVAPPPQAMEAVTPQAEPLTQPTAIPVAPPAEPAAAPAPPQAYEYWICTTEDGSARTVTAKGICPPFVVIREQLPPGMLIGCPTCGGTVVRQALPEEAPAAVS